VYCRPGREVARKLTPLATGAEQIGDCVEDGSDVRCTRTTTELRSRNVRSHQHPLFVSQIRGIAPASHDYLRAAVRGPHATSQHHHSELPTQSLSEQPWSFPLAEANVIVEHGEVHLWGKIATEAARRAILGTAEIIPGVRCVHDHTDYPPIHTRFLP